MKPIGADAGSRLQERNGERDEGSKDRRRGGKGRDDGADEAQQQGRQHRGGEPATLSPTKEMVPIFSSTTT